MPSKKSANKSKPVKIPSVSGRPSLKPLASVKPETKADKPKPNGKASSQASKPPSKPLVAHPPKRKPLASLKRSKTVASELLEATEVVNEQEHLATISFPEKGGRKPNSSKSKDDLKKSSHSSIPNPTDAYNRQVPTMPHTEDETSGIATVVPIGSQLLLPSANLRGRRPRLEQVSSEIYNKILLFIRAGAYKHQVAKGFGVSSTAFNAWLARGQDDIDRNKLTIYAQLVLDVEQAEGTARIQKELEVAVKNPEFWLKNGPGKTKPGEPGWTDTQAVEGGANPIEVNHKHSGNIKLESEVKGVHLVISKNSVDGRELIAGAMANLQQQGMIEPTEQGRKLFLQNLLNKKLEGANKYAPGEKEKTEAIEVD